MSSVTLICTVTADNESSAIVTSYQWNTTGCYTHPNRNNGNPTCFPDGQTTQIVTDNDVTAEDAGTITCTVTISGSDYTSEPFTLHISGEELVYCVIACRGIARISQRGVLNSTDAFSANKNSSPKTMFT